MQPQESDSDGKDTAALVNDIVAQVGSDEGRLLVFDRWEALSKAKSGAGRPTKKVKSPKSKNRPKNNPKG